MGSSSLPISHSREPAGPAFKTIWLPTFRQYGHSTSLVKGLGIQNIRLHAIAVTASVDRVRRSSTARARVSGLLSLLVSVNPIEYMNDQHAHK